MPPRARPHVVRTSCASHACFCRLYHEMKDQYDGIESYKTQPFAMRELEVSDPFSIQIPTALSHKIDNV